MGAGDREMKGTVSALKEFWPQMEIEKENAEMVVYKYMVYGRDRKIRLKCQRGTADTVYI